MKRKMCALLAMAMLMFCGISGAAAEQAEVEGDVNFSVGEQIFEFLRYDIGTDYEGKLALILSFDYTNNSKEANMAAYDFYVQVFQNGIEKDDCFLDFDSEWKEWQKNLTTNLKDGAKLTVCRAFLLDDTQAPVDVEVSEFVNYTETQKMAIDISQYSGSVPKTKSETEQIKTYESEYTEMSEKYSFLQSEYETLQSEYEALEAELEVYKGSATQESAGETMLSAIVSEKKVTNYSSGMYKVGEDIPAGEYVVFASGGSGYFCVSSDSNQDNILFNDNFNYNSIITINDGEYLDLSRCYAVPLEEEPEVKVTGEGMFKVGVHIPAGEYKLDSGADSGYYCIYPDSRQDNIIANDIFEGQNYVTVSDGQYLLLSRCKFVESVAEPMKTYDDAEMVKKVQEVLNTVGYDCGTPDGIAGSTTKSQIEKYQADRGLSETGTITEQLLKSLEILR